MKVFLLFIIMFLAGGCGKSFSENQQTKEPVEIQINSTESVVIQVNEGAEVGSYNVQFLPEDDSKYSIIKHDFLNGEISEIAVGVSGEYTDSEVVSGYVYKYEVGEFIEDKSFQKLFEKEIKIPVDLKLEELESRELETSNAAISTEGHSVLSINRLSLAKGSRLITQGQKIHLKINRLLSHEGTIATFNSGTKAEAGSAGRGGSELLIDAVYANGVLHIDLIGESGGDGIQPAPLGEIGRGEKGQPGPQGLARVDIYKGPNGLGSELEETECIESPGSGATGGKGKQGIAGNPGLQGGSTGLALIYIEESDSFNMSFNLQPGEGGNGSEGGLGGPGGFGGEPGREKVIEQEFEDGMPYGPERAYFNNRPVICGYTKSSEGPRGEIGAPGASGPPGNIQKICIKKNKDEQTTCFEKNKN